MPKPLILKQGALLKRTVHFHIKKKVSNNKFIFKNILAGTVANTYSPTLGVKIGISGQRQPRLVQDLVSKTVLQDATSF